MIHCCKEELDTIKAILAKYPYTFWAFGSRVRGDNKPFSDLDVCYKEDIPLLELCQIKSDFEESDLVFKVDLVGLKDVDNVFYKNIQNDLELLKR